MKQKTSFNQSRYRKVVWFFFTIFVHIIWWDLILRKIIFFRSYAKSSATNRWQRIARRFRGLALEMGGVLIKLGQFLSIRVDILPLEIISELANLQDEVPPANSVDVIALIEADFGCPLAEIFNSFDIEPIAAASLAQAHRATLKNGQKVVVKVQRPGIDVLVHTDLTAISMAIRWLKLYPRVRKRVNLDWLAEEFTTVTINELDFMAESKNAELFASYFIDEPVLYLPKIYWDYCKPRVLTMEDVSYIRIADLEALDAAGISRPRVAKKLYRIYMHQIFVTHFVHADPHPGNLFVRPLPRPEKLAPSEPTPFQIIFIDFGMVVSIPERLWSALRNYAIGLGTRDAHRMVQAYVEANTLLPGADLKRLEEAHQAIFDRFWGMGMTQLRDLAFSEAPLLMEEYRDLIYETPFQLQVDMLFAVRAVGILSGLTTNLDPHFNPWAETIPFAETLVREELKRKLQSWPQELAQLVRISVELGPKLDKVLSLAQHGSLSIETSLGPDSRKTIYKLEASVHRLTWTVATVGLLLAGIILRTVEGPNNLNTSFLVCAGLIFLWKVIKRNS